VPAARLLGTLAKPARQGSPRQRARSAGHHGPPAPNPAPTDARPLEALAGCEPRDRLRRMALTDVERQRRSRARRAERAKALTNDVTRIVTPIVTARDEMVEMLREIARAAYKANEWRDAIAAAGKAIDVMDRATIMAREAPPKEEDLSHLSDDQLRELLVADPDLIAMVRERLEQEKLDARGASCPIGAREVVASPGDREEGLGPWRNGRLLP